MFENIRLAFRGIWSHKMRSFLTMLGIIIGIAAIIAIVSTIKGTNEQIKQNLVGTGDNTVNVELYQGDWAYETEYNGIPDGVPVVGDTTLEEIKALDVVEDASLYHSRSVYDGIYYLNTALSGGYIKGVDVNYLNVCGYIMKEGRAFTEKDCTDSLKVAVLDEDAEDALFNGVSAMGKTIEIKGEPYVIIGVVTKATTFEPTINSIDDYYTYASSSGGNVFIPDTTWPIVYNYDEPQNVVLRTASVDDMTAAGKQTAELLNMYLSPQDSTIQYQAQDLLEQAKEIQQLSQSTNAMLIWIAGISLLVGGIGVMNIMLVSVTERTSEIGLKKAIGARKSKVLVQFLTEAAVLTSVGGIIGVIVGIILAEAISRLSSTPVAISVPAAVGAVVFSMLIGIIFGILPSYKAANLNPIDALRHE